MKVDPNQLVGSVAQRWGESDAIVGGIPLRLELAARFMAAVIANPKSENFWNDDEALIALDAADALIEAHNATCEVKNV